MMLRDACCSFLLLLAACGKSNSSPDAPGSFGGDAGKAAGGDAGKAAAGSAGSSKGGSAVGGAVQEAGSDGGGAPSSGAAGAAGTAGTAGAAGSPDEPSKQTVTFEVTNGATAPRSVAIEGAGCTPFMILATDPARLVRTSAANPCGPCMQCPNPPSGTKRVAELAPGQSVELSWDARQVSVAQQTAMCNGTPTPYTSVVASPVEAGSYRVRVAVFSTKPPGCSANGACDPPVTTVQEALPYADLCSSSAQVEADFELPAEGDVTVPVTIE
jgi:hypothetical protein